MPELSMRAYARHRKERGLPGGTINAVQKAVASGRIKRLPNGMLDRDQADAAWDNNTDAGRRRNVEEPRLKPVSPQRAPAPEPPPSDQTGSNYAQARAVREVFQARTARLEYERLVGKLVPADEIEHRWGTIITAARNRLLGIPSKTRVLIPQLTADDVELIDGLIREALEDLANGTGVRDAKGSAA